MTTDETIQIVTKHELMVVPLVSIGDWDKTRTVRWICIKNDDDDAVFDEEWVHNVGRFIDDNSNLIGDTFSQAVEKFSKSLTENPK